MHVVLGPDRVWVFSYEPVDGLAKITVSGVVFRSCTQILSELRSTPGVSSGSSFTLSLPAARLISERMLSSSGFECPIKAPPPVSRVIPDTGLDLESLTTLRDGKQVGLRPYQVEGCRWLSSNGLHGILGDEMGLGKTVQVSVALEMARKVRKRALVVTTKSTLHNWPVEAGWWAPSWKAVAVTDTKSFTKALAAGADLLVVSWGMLARLRAQLVAWAPDTLIADEAQYAKEGYKTDRGSAMAALSGSATSVLLMSGTPLLNRPAELWFLFHLICPEDFTTFPPYAERFCAPVLSQVWVKGVRRNFMDYSGSSNTDELAVELSKVQLRRKKSDVLKDLPALIESTCFVQPSAALRRSWLSALKALGSADGLDPAVLQSFLSVYKDVGLEKVDPACDLISGIVSSGDGPVIALVYNAGVHDALHSSLSAMGLRVCSIVGSTSGSSRRDIVRDFQAGCYDVLIGSEAVKEGVTLTRSHHVVQVQYWWTEAAMDQGRSRAHRFGQSSDVVAHYLHCSGTIDDHIVRSVRRKKALREDIVEAAASLLDIIRDGAE